MAGVSACGLWETIDVVDPCAVDATGEAEETAVEASCAPVVGAAGLSSARQVCSNGAIGLQLSKTSKGGRVGDALLR
jgi:hypothetical protein